MTKEETASVALPKTGGRSPGTLSMAALIRRINRRLAHEHERLRTSCGWRSKVGLGEHYVVNHEYNAVTATHVSLEAFGRELGVLKPDEQVQAGEVGHE